MVEIDARDERAIRVEYVDRVEPAAEPHFEYGDIDAGVGKAEQRRQRAELEIGQRHAVALPMTRSDIAGFLGLSLESVSRAAAELEQRGLVKFENRHRVRIVEADGFARLVAAV